MRSSDLPSVVAMLRGSYPPRLRPYMAYTQHGVMAFLEVHLLYPESFREKFFFVSTDDRDQVLGFAEFRLTTAKVGFLSYVCVAETSRGLGVATSLIHHFVSSQQLDRLELDVFDDNLPALRLYEQLGFLRLDQKMWFQRYLPSPSTPLSIPQFHVSSATYATYGFCEFSVEWRGQNIRLGRIGPNVLRCYDLNSFNDNDLMASAKAAIPSLTEALVILTADDGDIISSDSITVVLSNRLVKIYESNVLTSGIVK